MTVRAVYSPFDKLRVNGMLFILSTLLFPIPIRAVEVEPMRIERTVPAQEPSQVALTITNPAGKAVSVRLSVGPYRAFQPGLKFVSAEQWLSFEPATVILAPGASTTVELRVQPPPGAAQDTAGEYLAAVLIDELPAEETVQGDRRVEASSQIRIVPRLALPVYLKVQGRERVEVELMSMTLSTAQAETAGAESQPAPVLLRINTVLKNRGTVHIRPVGTFALFDGGSGELVRAFPLGRTLPLLAGAELTVPALLPLPLPGKYRLTLTLESGQPEPLQKEVRFEVTGEDQLLEGKSA